LNVSRSLTIMKYPSMIMLLVVGPLQRLLALEY
ncbi:hypothetical protein LCGC14_1101580, partial [marine sediment metagenome]